MTGEPQGPVVFDRSGDEADAAAGPPYIAYPRGGRGGGRGRGGRGRGREGLIDAIMNGRGRGLYRGGHDGRSGRLDTINNAGSQVGGIEPQ